MRLRETRSKLKAIGVLKLSEMSPVVARQETMFLLAEAFQVVVPVVQMLLSRDLYPAVAIVAAR